MSDDERGPIVLKEFHAALESLRAGPDPLLDALGLIYGLTRLVAESDLAFLRRIDIEAGTREI